ncbi:MAG: hypothetical protein CL678_17475 [Bdellovibrionaceae bacterium]|nr:hypothetical protein [Pseudobdellovibrionaceae bacterium]|tara:strand:- start:87 stop:713 length:627 start_codon:yes stop_codon:yes gene_type:complete
MSAATTPSNPVSDKAAAAAAATAAVEPPKADASPAQMSELEAALAAYSAANPADGRKLATQIAAMQRNLESTKRKAEELEQHARVDKDVMRNHLQQLLKNLSPDIAEMYCINENQINDQILSSNVNIAQDAAKRVIAACNAKFMQGAPSVAVAAATAAAAPVEETPPESNKRAKTEHVVKNDVSMVDANADEDGDASLLRRALSAVYE